MKLIYSLKADDKIVDMWLKSPIPNASNSRDKNIMTTKIVAALQHHRDLTHITKQELKLLCSKEHAFMLFDKTIADGLDREVLDSWAHTLSKRTRHTNTTCRQMIIKVHETCR